MPMHKTLSQGLHEATVKSAFLQQAFSICFYCTFSSVFFNQQIEIYNSLRLHLWPEPFAKESKVLNS